MSTDPTESPATNEQDTNENSPAAGAPSTENDAATRVRSTIAFPYGALKDAEHIAQELHTTWGDSASPEQLAGGLGQQPRSGAFRMKVATARTFGVVSVSRGNISLTPLGRRIIDPQARQPARIEAFEAVPLFSALLNEYKGALLPPDTGLEQKITELGVSSKQAAKARQAFQRSAESAGYFQHGRNRLVPPPTNVTNSGESKHDDSQEERENVTPPALGLAAAAVPLPELWLKLLTEGESWSAEKTQKFVEKARELHQLLSD